MAYGTALRDADNLARAPCYCVFFQHKQTSSPMYSISMRRKYDADSVNQKLASLFL